MANPCLGLGSLGTADRRISPGFFEVWASILKWEESTTPSGGDLCLLAVIFMSWGKR